MFSGMPLKSAFATTATLVMSLGASLSPFTDPARGDPAQQSRACAEGNTAAFGRYLGAWDVTTRQIGADGNWSDGPRGSWEFYCLGNGIAVIDIFRPDGGGFGSTVRMIDPETGQWDIIWTGEGSQAMSHLTGTERQDGSIEMHYTRPAFAVPRMITFTPPVDGRFEWTLLISRDEGESWQPVYAMTATRKPDQS